MKIIDVPLKNVVEGDDAAVLAFFNEHSAEVFLIADAGGIAGQLGMDTPRVERSMRRLTEHGMLSRARLHGEKWYGSHAAVEQLCLYTSDAVRV